MGRALGEFQGTGYQSERNKVVGLDGVVREMTLSEISDEGSALSFSRSPIMVP